MSLPKAVLYYSPIAASVWSAAVLFALQEKGYAQDDLRLQQVDIDKGTNFDPAFLRLNPEATLPILVVPLQETIPGEVESRYKAITETESIIAFLDKSRSVISRTRSSSNAPAPALAPATIALASLCKCIINDLHAEQVNPDTLRYYNARDDESLRILARKLLPDLIKRQQTLAQYISDAEQEKIHVSTKTINFWRSKQQASEALFSIFKDAEKTDGDTATKRAEYFQQVHHSWDVNLREVLKRVNEQIIGPFCLGDQFSTADVHLASWMAMIVKYAGGAHDDEGNKLHKHIGSGFMKLEVFWDAVRKRESWRTIYACRT